MAELHVQPKRNNYWWLWLLLVILIIAAAVYYYLNYYQKGNTLSNSTTTDSTSYNRQNNATTDSTNVAPANANLWSQINFNSPDTIYAEVTDKNVTEKANAHFVIYSINDNALFDNNKSDLRDDGKRSLKQIGASIDKRFENADVRIYNQTDSLKRDQLADERAEAVKKYLINNSKLKENHISVYKVGESSSLPTNSNTIDIVVNR